MLNGKKLAKETLLPSVLEDNDAESERLQLGEVGELITQPSLQTVEKVWMTRFTSGDLKDCSVVDFSEAWDYNKHRREVHLVRIQSML